MQYLIRMVCDESTDFRRDILIDEDATFLELSDTILKSCAYPDNQMNSFYICDEEWQRGEQITREDVRDSAADEDLYTMADTRLSEFLDGGVRHLEYVFDTFNDRVFSLCVRGEEPGDGAPEVVKSVGEAPLQIADADPMAGTFSTGGADFTEDFGIESYNADEIDFDGFEISDGTSF